MFHRFICRFFVMLFGVPFFPLGCNYGMSSPGGKISFAYTQVKPHAFNSSAIEICLRIRSALIAAIGAVIDRIG